MPAYDCTFSGPGAFALGGEAGLAGRGDALSPPAPFTALGGTGDALSPPAPFTALGGRGDALPPPAPFTALGGRGDALLRCMAALALSFEAGGGLLAPGTGGGRRRSFSADPWSAALGLGGAAPGGAAFAPEEGLGAPVGLEVGEGGLCGAPFVAALGCMLGLGLGGLRAEGPLPPVEGGDRGGNLGAGGVGGTNEAETAARSDTGGTAGDCTADWAAEGGREAAADTASAAATADATDCCTNCTTAPLGAAPCPEDALSPLPMAAAACSAASVMLCACCSILDSADACPRVSFPGRPGEDGGDATGERSLCGVLPPAVRAGEDATDLASRIAEDSCSTALADANKRAMSADCASNCADAVAMPACSVFHAALGDATRGASGLSPDVTLVALVSDSRTAPRMLAIVLARAACPAGVARLA